MKKNLGLIPLINFASLNDQLFRSAQPEYDYQYNWLKDVIGINVIINLRSESRHDDAMCADNGIKVVNVDVVDHKEPTKHQAMYFIQLIKSHLAQGGNVLFHCEHGHGRTSTFCVLARLAMGWNLDEAIAEEEKKFHYNFKHPAQKEFLQKHFSQYKTKEYAK